MNDEFPQWFVSEIADGLQRLVVLSLSGTPASETITATAQIWIETVWFGGTFGSEPQEGRDVPRLRSAFRWLACDVDRWPAPKQLIGLLPALPPPRALPPPQPKVMSRADLERIDHLFSQLRNLCDHPPRPEHLR